MSGDEAPLAGPDLRNGVAAGDIAEGSMLLGHAEGEAVLLARTGGMLCAIAARCAHYGGPLNEGLIVGDTVRCPWHHAAFNLRTGEAVRPPALNNLSCWQVEERDGTVVVTGKKTATVSRPATTGAPGARPRGPASVVIVGGGAAGAVAAETLRREGYDGPVTIIEAGPSAPYDRPNLSKDFLAGTAPEEWIPLHPDAFYQDNGIELLLGRRVTTIDAKAKRLTLDDGSTRDYGALLLATGAEPVRLTIPNILQQVYYLRTLADSRELIAAARAGARAVVLGASFIGLEVAASLRARGLDVTVVGPEARPLERVLGADLGDHVRSLHESHGVAFRLGHTASAIDRSRVTLSGGASLPADLVIAGIGVRPDTTLARAAGLKANGGMLVDEFLETSAPGIYAAGDVASWPDPHTGERIRVEHWVVAQRQGQAAARNILGHKHRFDAVPFFWSRHYDVTIAYTGHARAWDSAQVEGDISANDCEVTYRSGDRVLAVATIFRDQASLQAELLMERSIPSSIGTR
ncbi:MAG: FAD-dependent oxidoreductase [Gemmatimonadaceae bacterium]